jgi:hypothetical protein
MRYERIKVKRDLNTVHSKEVAPWEVPVIEFIFEDGNVERTDVFLEVARDYPDPQREFERLTKCYGSDPQSGVPYAASVFGNASTGVRNLRKMIEEAKEQDEAAVEEKAPVPAPARKRSRQTQVADSLLG